MESIIIHDRFTNIYGKHFDNIKELIVAPGVCVSDIWTIKDKTKHTGLTSLESLSDGVYIFQDNFNLNIGYRIYKEFADYGFNGYSDDKLISNLQLRQNNIKKSTFPYGVVTRDSRIIGQIIPFYGDSVSLNAYSSTVSDISKIKPTTLYKEIIEILKELYDNGIMYLDNHTKNFMINPNGDRLVNIIDFDSGMVSFDEAFEFQKDSMFGNLESMINRANKNFKLDGELEVLHDIHDFDTFEEKIDNMEKHLVKANITTINR